MQNVHQLHYNHRLTKEEQEAETMAITTRIAEIVKHSGYSREELADRIGVSSSAITNISGRSRNVTPGMLARISLGIGISVDQGQV